jgi:S-adenosylmethionine decarboxylase
MTPHNLGKHILVDFHDCNSKKLDDPELIKKVMLDSARLANATIITDVFHRFNPHGLSGVVVIAESHLAIHTWPEFGIAAVDLFTCSNTMLPHIAIDYIARTLESKNYKVHEIQRGAIIN